jgi:Trk K+ transport system NAD-binding subunit
VITEVSVVLGSELEGKSIKDILWPENCLLVSIKRGDKEIIPKGKTKVLAGDFIYVLTDENQAVQVKRRLMEMSYERE